MVIKAIRIFAFFWVFVLCAGTIQYLTFKPDTAFLALKQFAVKTGIYLPAFYAHIFGASTILITGFFQFSKWVYTRRALHKILGKIYILGVLFFAAPGAYVMTFFIHRGTGVFISFLLQNTLWIAFTLSAWILIKRRKIDAHIMMMRRSYTLAFAAVTLRFYIWLFTVFGNGVGFANNYMIIAFLSWVPNLIVVEVFNYYDQRQLVGKSL